MDAKQIAESHAAILHSLDPFQLVAHYAARWSDARYTGRLCWERREKLQGFQATVPGVMSIGPAA